MKKIVIATLLSAFIAAPAVAADEGFYVGADLGAVSYSNATVPNQTESYPNPGSVRIAGGYNFVPYLGVEVAYSVIGDSTVDYSNASTILKASVLQVAAVGTYSINDKFDVFGKLGMASNSVKVSGSGAAAGLGGSASTTNLMFGFGGQYNINQHFGIRAQYVDFGKAKMTATLSGVAQTPSSIGIKVIYVGGVYNF
jgi:OmpA-OmpF porin, OOP family